MTDEHAKKVSRQIEQISRYVLAGFAVCLGLMAVFVALLFTRLTPNRFTYSEFVSLVSALLFSGATYIGLLFLRELVVWRQKRFHFSLRTLLIFTTLVAVVLGVLVWAVRN